MVCRTCGNTVSSDDETTCPNCGADLQPSLEGAEDKSEGLRQMSQELRAIDADTRGYTSGDLFANRFEIEEYVGSGPLGEVYRARDQRIETSVALKVFEDALIETPPEQEVFTEATGAAREMSQENVVRVHDSGVHDEVPWVSMQYLEGLTLRKVLEMRENKGERFGRDEIEPVISQITLALQHIERSYPVGTLKPENIYLLPELLKVTDGYLWGAFPSERLLDRLDDHDYLAPELTDNPDEVDARCDVYSLGYIIGEMLLGPEYRPGEEDVDSEEEAAIDELCLRATADDPEARYPDVEALSEDFLTWVDTGQLLESPPSSQDDPTTLTPEDDASRAGPDEKTSVVTRDEAPLPSSEAESSSEESDDPSGEGLEEELPAEEFATEEYDRDEDSAPEGPQPSEDQLATEEYSRNQTPSEDQLATEEYDRDAADGGAGLDAGLPPEPGEQEESNGGTLPDLDPPGSASSAGGAAGGDEQQDSYERTVPAANRPQAPPSERDEEEDHTTSVIAVLVLLGFGAGIVAVTAVASRDGGEDATIAIQNTSPDAQSSDLGTSDVGGDTPSPENREALDSAYEASRTRAIAAMETARKEARAEADTEDTSNDSSSESSESPEETDDETARGAARRSSDDRGGRAAQKKDEEKTDCPDSMALIERDSGNYCIDKFEYPGQGRKPTVRATWFQAQSTCEDEGKRLCTLAEWRRACGWETYPYGSEWNPSACNTQNKNGFARSLAATGSFRECRSWSGAYDMTGNVHEWVKEQQIAGGGFDSGPEVASCQYASPKNPGSSTRTIGFRCCADPE